MIPQRNQTGRSSLIAATFFLSVFFSFTPAATAQSGVYVETFEDLSVGGVPHSVAGQYNYAFVGAGSAVAVSSPVLEDTRAIRIKPGAGNAATAFTGTQGDFCDESGGVSFTLRLDALPTSGANVYGITEHAPGEFGFDVDGVTFFQLSISTAGVASMVIENNPTAIDGRTTDIITGLTIAPDTNYHFEMSCPAQGTTGTYRILETTNVLDAQRSVSRSANGGSNGDDNIFVAYALSGQTDVWIDEISFYRNASGSGAFCADHSIENFGGIAEADYGYTYRRGGDFFDQEDGDITGIGLSTGFDYTGGNGNGGDESENDYSAKTFSTGSKALHENITIESAEGSPPVESSFRVNFITTTGGTADATTKGNGFNTGHFANHVEARMQAMVADSWQISFWYVDAGGTRTQMGSNIIFGDSLDATQFTVWIDTRTTANIITTLDTYHNDDYYFLGAIHADPFIAITSDSAADGPNGEEITLLGIRYLDDYASSAFVDDTVGHLWNVAGGQIGVASSWHIALDESDQEGRANTDDEGGLDSTCIFDDAGTLVFAGSQGATPGSQVAGPSPTPSATPGPGGGLVGSEGAAHTTGNPLGNFIAYQNTAWGFDVSAIFAGIVLLVLLVIVIIATKGNLFAGMVTVLVVGGIEVSLGLFGPAMIFLLALLCAGFAAGGIFQARNNQGGDTA